MILHITFSDGSNPWVSLPTDRHTIKKQWCKWMKYHPLTAQPKVYYNGYICELSPDFMYRVYKRGEYFATKRYYKHLGHALVTLERLGGENK
jgi:hypothetical protein